MERLENFLGEDLLSGELLRTLRAAGCLTVMDFLDREPSQLAAIGGISIKVVRKLRTHLLLSLSPPFTSGAARLQMKQNSFRRSISFGIPAVDELFGGQLRCGEILELCGPPLSGKTQLLLQLIVTTLRADSHARILYLDSCGQFSPMRLHRMLGAGGANCNAAQIKSCLSRIDVAPVNCCERLLQLLDTCASWSEDSSIPSGSAVVIVDVLYSLLAPFVGGKSFCDYRLLNAVGQAFGYLTDSLGMTVVYTNSAFSHGGHIHTPALGSYWTSVPHHRLLLTNNQKTNEVESEIFHVELLKSTSQRCDGKRTKFKIDTNGNIHC